MKGWILLIIILLLLLLIYWYRYIYEEKYAVDQPLHYDKYRNIWYFPIIVNGNITLAELSDKASSLMIPKGFVASVLSKDVIPEIVPNLYEPVIGFQCNKYDKLSLCTQLGIKRVERPRHDMLRFIF